MAQENRAADLDNKRYRDDGEVEPASLGGALGPWARFARRRRLRLVERALSLLDKGHQSTLEQNRRVSSTWGSSAEYHSWGSRKQNCHPVSAD